MPAARRPTSTTSPFSKRKGVYGTLSNINGVEDRKSEHLIDVTRRETKRVLERFDATADVRPWFVVMAPYLPHMPSIPEPRYVDDHVDDRVSIRTLDQRWERDQLRCLLSLDDTVDEIYDHLATLEKRANLLSFYLSDNGYMWASAAARPANAGPTALQRRSRTW